MKVVSVAQMREIEQRAVADFGISTLVMMENAGASSACLIREMYPDPQSAVVVVAGRGNNGGDGFVVARHLLNAGLPVTSFFLGEPQQLKGDALTNWQILKRMSERVFAISREEDLPRLTRELINCELIVDALLGTGIRGKVEGFFASVIELINSIEIPVVALDTPSGLDVDRGVLSGPLVAADQTITMGLPKKGFFHPQAISWVGDLSVADIGIPQSLLSDASLQINLVEEAALPLLPSRPLNTHKGEAGRLFILAGSSPYSGAAVLTGLAAMKSGASYVTLGVPRNISAVVNSHLLEVVVEPLSINANGGLAYANMERLLQIADKADAVVLGPGLGQEVETAKLVAELIGRIKRPLIVDADALNILANSDLSPLENRRGSPTLLTPHFGEFSRLLHRSKSDIAAERFALTGNFAREKQVNLILKGPASVISSPMGEQFINPTGGPELATAGSGDVLSGLLGGICAQGLDLLSTAVLGCFWHGLSGELAAGELTLINAADIAYNLPRAYSLLLKGRRREHAG